MTERKKVCFTIDGLVAEALKWNSIALDISQAKLVELAIRKLIGMETHFDINKGIIETSIPVAKKVK